MKGGVPPALPGPLPAGRTRPELVAEVGRALAGVPADATVVVAVSGGPDSTACAFLAGEARPDLTLVLGHVRHGLRDDRYDVAAVEASAAFLGVDLRIEEVTVEPAGEGVEAAARSQRYAALRRIARDVESGWILLGHTAEDQAETLFLRLARGTGVPGLGGMAPVRGDLLRPLLRLRRSDVHRFVALEGLPAVEDPTNQDRRIPRNLVRHELLPRLAEVGPDVVGALARLADLARDDARTLDAVAAAAAADVVRHVGPVVAVPIDFLADADAAVTRRVLRQLVLAVRGVPDPPTAAEVETLRGLTVGALDLSGASVSAAGGWLAVAPPELPAQAPVALPLPGRAAWPVAGWQVRARTPETPGQGQLQLGLVETWRPPHVAIADDLLPPGGDVTLGQVVLGGLAVDELTLRTRAPGDRIVTGAGTRKLQDVYVDAGVPRLMRDLLPVVLAGDRVVWVPGLAVDEHARLRGLANPQVHLAVSRR